MNVANACAKKVPAAVFPRKLNHPVTKAAKGEYFSGARLADQ